MNNLETRAQSLFNNPHCSVELNQYNQQKWVAAMEYLGDKHILAVNIEKKVFSNV